MNITPELLAIILYVAILFTIGFFSYRRNQTATDFIIGGRSLNYWVTAMAAHASDMGSWLFMGYPAVIFLEGLFNVWIAVGLTLFMLLNWLFIAPKIRMKTEEYKFPTVYDGLRGMQFICKAVESADKGAVWVELP